jgi:hypothetical protein
VLPAPSSSSCHKLILFISSDVIEYQRKKRLELTDWLMNKSRTMPCFLCRGEGFDDAIFIDTLITAPFEYNGLHWNDFSYRRSDTQVEMKIRVQNVQGSTCRMGTGICEFPMKASEFPKKGRTKAEERKEERKKNTKNSDGSRIQDWIPTYPGDDRAQCRLIDLVDGDLNAPICKHGPVRVKSSSYVSFYWRSRAIENMLLPSTCPLYVVQEHRDWAAIHFREVFQRIFKNFFSGDLGDTTFHAPSVKQLKVKVPQITTISETVQSAAVPIDSVSVQDDSVVSSVELCDEKLKKLIPSSGGPGWLGWHMDLSQDQLTEYSAMDNFIENVIEKLHSSVSANNFAPSVMVLYELFCQVLYDADTDSCRRLNACEERLTYVNAHADLWGESPQDWEFAQAESILFRKIQISPVDPEAAKVAKKARQCCTDRYNGQMGANRSSDRSFRIMFPQFIGFLNRLFCLDLKTIQNVRLASLQVLHAVFSVICSKVFELPVEGESDDLPLDSISYILLKSRTDTQCEGYLPRTDSKACMKCNQSEECHILRFELNNADWRVDDQQSSGDNLEPKPDRDRSIFSRLVCRVGSMGWHSHDYMTLVHGSKHLGEEFHQDHITETRDRYREHLLPEVVCQDCLSRSRPFQDLLPHLKKEVELLNRQRKADQDDFLKLLE